VTDSATTDSAPLPADPYHPVLAGDAMSEWLGVRLVEARNGYALLEAEVRPDHTNGFGIAHGGFIFAIADTAFAMACNDINGDGATVTVAAGADVTYLRAGKVGTTLRVVAEELHRGRSGLYDVRVVEVAADGSEGPVLAQFRGRSRTIPGNAVPHPVVDRLTG